MFHSTLSDSQKGAKIMTRYELIVKCESHLGAAEGCNDNNDHEHYAEHMQQLLDLLIEELVGSAPGAPKPPKTKRSKSCQDQTQNH